jgi:OmpA-OmpF porin, OOP family
LPAGAVAGTIYLTPPRASGYAFTASRDGGKITLNGYVPTLQLRDLLRDKAKAVVGSQGTVDDKLEYASGSPASFAAAAGFAVSSLAHVSKGSVSLSGAQVSLKGVALGGAGFAGLLAAVQNLPAGVSIGANDVIPAAASPYVFSVARNNTGIELRGFAPSEAVLNGLVAAAKKAAGPDGRVTNNLQYASGAARNFEARALYGAGLVGRLKQGVFELDGDTASLKGVAPDSVSFEALRSEMTSLPHGLKAGTISLTPPVSQSYSFSVARNGGQIVLSGSISAPRLRSELNGVAKGLPAITSVEDRLTYASGAPDKFEQIAKAGVTIAGRLQAGRFSYINGKVSVSGEAADSATYEQIRKELLALPGGVDAASNAVVPPAADVFGFEVAKTAQALVLGGQVPSADVRQALAAAARSAAPGLQVEDKLVFASGAPDNFQALAQY